MAIMLHIISGASCLQTDLSNQDADECKASVWQSGFQQTSDYCAALWMGDERQSRGVLVELPTARFSAWFDITSPLLMQILMSAQVVI